MDIQKIVSQMTLREKLAQMVFLVQCYQEDVFHEDEGRRKFMCDDAATRFGIDAQDVINTGGIMLVDGAERAKQIYDRHMAHDPNKIPPLFMCDVIHGFRTIFPIPLALGCTFEEEPIETMARVSAVEASVSGINITFSPMLDLVRDARWGRVLESTGEDPYLNSLLARAIVRGYQGDNFSKPYYVGACFKHFAAYGAPEAGREYNTVELSEMTFRNAYMPAYKAAIEAGAVSAMSSFNTLNGVPSTVNRRLLRGILKEEYGFDGFVISDWGTTHEQINHGVAADQHEEAILAINAGLDMEMQTTIFLNEGEALVKEGLVKEEDIDDAVLRILRIKERLGLFEKPYGFADEELEKKYHLCPEHRAEARRVAAKTFVLLKNEKETLPLSKEEAVAFVGPYADTGRLFARWGWKGKTEETVTVRQGVEAKQAKAIFANACDFTDMTTLDIDAALAAAKDADKIVLCLGENEDMCGEGASRAFLTLPEVQLRLADAVLALGKPTILLLFGGRPQEIRLLAERCDAVLNVWLPGTEGGNAIADVLYGDVLPEGRLSMSFPYTVGQCPVYYNQLNTNRPAKPDDRCTSKYIDIPNSPLYSFGYGLGYSTTVLQNLQLSSERMEESITVSVDVTNTGSRPITETIQLYIRDLVASVSRPIRELKGIQKRKLMPGETQTVELLLKKEDLAFWHEDGTYAEPGKFRVMVGKCAEDDAMLMAEFEL